MLESERLRGDGKVVGMREGKGKNKSGMDINLGDEYKKVRKHTSYSFINYCAQGAVVPSLPHLLLRAQSKQQLSNQHQR